MIRLLTLAYVQESANVTLNGMFPDTQPVSAEQVMKLASPLTESILVRFILCR